MEIILPYDVLKSKVLFSACFYKIPWPMHGHGLSENENYVPNQIEIYLYNI